MGLLTRAAVGPSDERHPVGVNFTRGYISGSNSRIETIQTPFDSPQQYDPNEVIDMDGVLFLCPVGIQS